MYMPHIHVDVNEVTQNDYINLSKVAIYNKPQANCHLQHMRIMAQLCRLSISTPFQFLMELFTSVKTILSWVYSQTFDEA